MAQIMILIIILYLTCYYFIHYIKVIWIFAKYSNDPYNNFKNKNNNNNYPNNNSPYNQNNNNNNSKIKKIIGLFALNSMQITDTIIL